MIYNLLTNSNVFMIDNFFEQDDYHSYDNVYQHTQTHNWIYIGDVQSALDQSFLQNCKIITVTAAKDMEHVKLKSYIKHIIYPLLDGKQQNISSYFQQFYNIVQQSIKKGNILVHCAAGISRSATLVISYVIKKQKIPFKQAITLIRKSRPSVLPNLGFERQLKQYAQKILKNDKASRSSKRSNSKTCVPGKNQKNRQSNYQLSRLDDQFRENSRIKQSTQIDIKIIKNNKNIQQRKYQQQQLDLLNLKTKLKPPFKRGDSFSHKNNTKQDIEDFQKHQLTPFMTKNINDKAKSNRHKQQMHIFNKKIQIKNPLNIDRQILRQLGKKDITLS